MAWKKVVRISVSALLTLLILCSLIGMILLGIGVANAGRTGTFNLFGSSWHLNKSTAMEPDILQNDLVIVEHTDFSDIQVGDYAAFYFEEEGEEHLLIRKVENIDGLLYTVVDNEGGKIEISAENSRFLGKAVSRSEKLGRAVLFLQSEDGKMIFIGWTAGVALCLIGFTILFHLIWKNIAKKQSGLPADSLTGEALAYDEKEPVAIKEE